jgi:aerobic-type carbon monoxide dehydrogenase small subunit (CoxS/CutS family)
MDRSAGASAETNESAEMPEDVTLNAVSGGVAGEEGPLTRRRVLSASAILAAATVTVAGGAGASEAFAASKKKAPKSKGITININGKNHTTQATPDTPLLYVLRNELHLRGAKFGCGLSECGACAVLMNGKQIRSCVMTVKSVAGSKIVTLDGLAASYLGEKAAKKGKLHPLQQAWIDEQVPQCGYCQSGMIIQAADLLAKKKSPTTAEIKTAMNGHLCRCGTYNGIIAAIHRAAKEMAKK